jgi:amino acid transporter
MLLVLSVVALVKVGSGTAPPGHLTPSISWLNPFKISSFSAFASGIILMVFIYWGWDTAVSVNEETRDRNRTPGLAAIFSTIILLVTYGLVIFSMQAFAGVKTTGNGLGNVNNAGDVLSVQGSAIFGTTGFGPVFYHLLLLMVLSSAAASTQTTILPTARTTLSPVPDAHGVDGAHGSDLHRHLRGTELHVQRQRGDRRRGARDRPVHRVLLRPDRFRLRLVLP